jgi:hypothetical protein
MDELTKTVEIEGRSFQVRKPTAIDGIKIAKKIAASVLSATGEAGGFASLLSIDVNRLANLLDGISDDEVAWLIKKSLSLCSEKLPAGWTQVIDAAGQYQVADLEYDPILTIKLVTEAIKWGVGGFFDESRWKAWGLLVGLPGLDSKSQEP